MVTVKTFMVPLLAGALAFVSAPAPVPASLAGTQPQSAGGAALRIEQVQARLPEINVWFYGGEGGEAGDISAQLGARLLTSGETRPVTPEDTTRVFFLVDCSTSTTYAQMEAVKAALSAYADTMDPGERVTLISFGVEVELVLDASESPNELRGAAAALRANQPGTLFFDAMAKAAELAGREEYALDRKLVYVFSDSVDYNLGGYTREEVEELAVSAGMPVYALGFNTGTKEGLDHFGALARSTGGDISIVDESTLAGAVQELTTRAKSATLARFTAQSNVIEASPGVLGLVCGGQSAQASVPLRFWTPDTSPPSVLSAAQRGEDGIVLAFSEPVRGANLRESYTVSNADGSLLGVAPAAYDADSRTATLTLERPPANATLSIACPGITDVSMEQNPLPEAVSLPFTGPGEPEPPDAGTPPDSTPVAAWVLLTLVAVAILLAVAVAALKKRNGPSAQGGQPRPAGQMTDEVEETLQAGPAPQVHFVQNELPLVRLDVTGAAGEVKRVEIPVNKTLFVGRGNICDVVFDDAGMSRQHFVIEESGGAYSITNLSQSGGTKLNGVPLGATRPLNSGDAIEAGHERIVFFAAGGPQ